MLLGAIAVIIGLAYYARAKGRSPWWGLFGFAWIVGLLVLASLKDHALNGKNQSVGDV
jgi:hypothetical protein